MAAADDECLRYDAAVRRNARPAPAVAERLHEAAHRARDVVRLDPNLQIVAALGWMKFGETLDAS